VAEGLGVDMERWSVVERRRWIGYRPVGLVAKTIEVLYIEADGTGVPMVREELVGRRGKQADGSARTRDGGISSRSTTSAPSAACRSSFAWGTIRLNGRPPGPWPSLCWRGAIRD
jgi:hypothetical protein